MPYIFLELIKMLHLSKVFFYILLPKRVTAQSHQCNAQV